MTVRELIEKLQAMPQDVEVIHRMHSDYELLPEPDLRRKIVLRAGRYVDYLEHKGRVRPKMHFKPQVRVSHSKKILNGKRIGGPQ